MTVTIVDLVNIRELRSTDINFLLDSSTRCLGKYTESIVKGYEPIAAHQHLEKIIFHALMGVPNKIDYSVYVATSKEDSESIMAYIIADTKTNHIFFQYTKYAFRKLGIQRLLMGLVIDSDEPITVNFPTKEMLKLQKAGRISINNKFLENLLQ